MISSLIVFYNEQPIKPLIFEQKSKLCTAWPNLNKIEFPLTLLFSKANQFFFSLHPLITSSITSLINYIFGNVMLWYCLLMKTMLKVEEAFCNWTRNLSPLNHDKGKHLVVFQRPLNHHSIQFIEGPPVTKMHPSSRMRTIKFNYVIMHAPSA